MTGKLTNFGLVLIVALAVGAVAAGGASAEGTYIFESTHTTVAGSQTEVSEFETSIGVVKCQKATFSATGEAKEASELVITPAYSECKGPGELSATIDVNGCKYKLLSPTETGQSPPADLHAEVQIVKCTKAIEVTATGCTIKIPEQTPGTPTVDLSNKGTEPLKALVSPTVKGFSYSYSGIFCGSGSGSNGAYHGAVEAQGVVVLGNPPWFSIKRIGGTAKEGANGVCEFAAAGQTCQIQFKDTSTRTLRILNVQFFGLNPKVRYKKLVGGCAFNAGLGECVDELEAAKFEAGGINDYCMTVEDKANNAEQQYCRLLRM
jgi:hypothetical protein